MHAYKRYASGAARYGRWDARRMVGLDGHDAQGDSLSIRIQKGEERRVKVDPMAMTISALRHNLDLILM